MFTNHSEMVTALKKNPGHIHADLTAIKIDVWHMGSCIVGEAGELFHAICEQDNENIIEELGDIEFYLEGLRQALNIERNETLCDPDNHDLGLIADLHSNSLPFSAASLFDVLKKHIIYGQELNMVALLRALLEFESVLEGIRDDFNITWEETLVANLDKLNKRYAEGKFSDAQAQARADKLQEAVNNATA